MTPQPRHRDLLKKIVSPPADCPDVTARALQLLADFEHLCRSTVLVDRRTIDDASQAEWDEETRRRWYALSAKIEGDSSVNAGRPFHL